MKQMACKEIVARKTALVVVSAILIASYILFGGLLIDKTNLRRKKFIKNGLVPGLLNTGNSCFLNCVLQSMASCSSFIQWLINDHLRIHSTVLITSLGQMLNTLNKKSNDDIASASGVMRALYIHGWKISPDEQQDAHELFLALMQTLNDDLERVRNSSISLLNVSWVVNLESEEINKVLPEVKFPTKFLVSNKTLCDESFLEIGTGNDASIQGAFNCQRKSVISKVSTSLKQIHSSNNYEWLECPFRGSIASQLQCSFCGFKKPETLSSFISLSLSIPDRPALIGFSLNDLLKFYIRPEIISDVTCDGCSKRKSCQVRSTFSKQLTILKLPDCLCIHIQRTTWSTFSSAIKKHDFIHVPLMLNMKPYTYMFNQSNLHNQERRESQNINGPLRSSLSSFNVTSGTSTQLASTSKTQFTSTSPIISRGSWTYSLKSVIVHIGDLQFGHFVTYRKGNDDSSFRNKWFYTSDVDVKEVDESEVLKADAYMIIYEKLSS